MSFIRGASIVVAVVATCALAAACGDDACNAHYQCASSETCWSMTNGESFVCTKAGTTSALGDCTPDLTRTPECGPGLVCVSSASGTGGTCREWCTSKLDCALSTSN